MPSGEQIAKDIGGDKALGIALDKCHEYGVLHPGLVESVANGIREAVAAEREAIIPAGHMILGKPTKVENPDGTFDVTYRFTRTQAPALQSADHGSGTHQGPV